MEYWNAVEDAEGFQKMQKKLVIKASQDSKLISKCDSLITDLEDSKYAYQWNWMGVPIIKYPEDIVLIQQAFFEFRPDAVVEVGVARGGGIALSHSLQKLMGLHPKILGIDIKFHSHTIVALQDYLKEGVQLFESDSTSEDTAHKIKDFLAESVQPFVMLDSNHTHEHVLSELILIDKVAPKGTIVLVADTVVGYSQSRFKNRPWDNVFNPLSAVRQFLKEKINWELLSDFATRGLISENRYGWIKKVDN